MELAQIMGWWGLIGFFALPFMKSPTNRKSALIKLFISGPIGWLLFIPISIWVLTTKKQKGQKYGIIN